jgi:hypothetical protein
MAKRRLSDAEVLRQIPGARRRAQQSLVSEPHAKQVRFNGTRRAVYVLLTNGAAFEVPIELIPSLRTAGDTELADVRVGPAGVGIHWERLDTDLSVARLASAALGPAVLLRAAGSAGGASRTRAKTRAARANGLKGGRPRKSQSATAA